MVKGIYKNHLADLRLKLGLSQRQVARILGLKSPARICLLESGRGIPRATEFVAFAILYRRSFEKLWPRLQMELAAETDLNIRRFIEELEAARLRSARKRLRAKALCRALAIIVDGLPEDLSDVL